MCMCVCVLVSVNVFMCASVFRHVCCVFVSVFGSAFAAACTGFIFITVSFFVASYFVVFLSFMLLFHLYDLSAGRLHVVSAACTHLRAGGYQRLFRCWRTGE